MSHPYRVTLEKAGEPSVEPITSTATNHDDLHRILEPVRKGGLLPQDEAVDFAVGLKLFTEIVLRHRRPSMFANLLPQPQVFMKRLKQGAVDDDARSE